MKYKKIIFITTVLFFGVLVWNLRYVNQPDGDFEDFDEQEAIVKNIRVKASPSFEYNDSSNVSSFIQDTNNTEYFNEIYTLIAPKNGAIKKIVPGKEIEVENFFNATEEYSYFIPFYFDARVVAVSIFREYCSGKKELGRVGEIRENWFSYPPVLLSDATNTLQNEYPDVNINHIAGYYYIEDGETPFYLYKGDDGKRIKYYLVSAYDRHIVVKKRRKIKIIKEPVYGKINRQGFLEIDEAMASKLSKKEQEKLRMGATITNEYIQKGIMKFDRNMNIIFDKRTKEDFEKERLLDEKFDENMKDNYTYDRGFTLDSDMNNADFEKKFEF